MSSNVHHSTFVIQRDLATDPERAFRFFADSALKESWNACHPDWTVLEQRFDFRVGGDEIRRWRMPGGSEQTFTARYFDIAAGERIVYAFEMSVGGKRVSISLATIELEPGEAGTHMTYTEQMAFLGTVEERHLRVAGTGTGFDRLEEAISAQAASSLSLV